MPPAVGEPRKSQEKRDIKGQHYTAQSTHKRPERTPNPASFRTSIEAVKDENAAESAHVSLGSMGAGAKNLNKTTQKPTFQTPPRRHRASINPAKKWPWAPNFS